MLRSKVDASYLYAGTHYIHKMHPCLHRTHRLEKMTLDDGSNTVYLSTTTKRMKEAMTLNVLSYCFLVSTAKTSLIDLLWFEINWYCRHWCVESASHVGGLNDADSCCVMYLPHLTAKRHLRTHAFRESLDVKCKRSQAREYTQLYFDMRLISSTSTCRCWCWCYCCCCCCWCYPSTPRGYIGHCTSQSLRSKFFYETQNLFQISHCKM